MIVAWTTAVLILLERDRRIERRKRVASPEESVEAVPFGEHEEDADSDIKK